MMAKIINKEREDFEKSFKIKSLNYDMVVLEDKYNSISLSMKEVEIVPENQHEETISHCKDILKVRLNKNISSMLYIALINCIREKINDSIESIEVLKDEYKINKRGIWDKILIIVINETIPLDILIVGMKYSTEFSITLREITLNDFADGCSVNIKRLGKEIEEKEKNIIRYKKSLNSVLNRPSIES